MTDPILFGEKCKSKLPHWLRHDWGQWNTFEIQSDHVSNEMVFKTLIVTVTRMYQSRKCKVCGKYQQERIYY